MLASLSGDGLFSPAAGGIAPEGGDLIIIYTIGHSTRTVEEFVRILHAHEIQTVVDVRTIAASRHNPQYNETELRKSLSRAGIEYIRMKGLGGLRHTTKASPNTAWRNAAFRGFADYMQTAEFAENIEQLIKIAAEKRTAILCAEAVPWRCHRSLIGDALLVRNVPVVDIMSEKAGKPHILTSFARVDGQRITYPDGG
ncbi:MAG: DUF488 domain-containing protein [Syntrophales bacterium]|nr:DUF488 domain-containing protein [Syntrophales bacterium]